MKENDIEFEFWAYFKGLTRVEQYQVYRTMQDMLYAPDIKYKED